MLAWCFGETSISRPQTPDLVALIVGDVLSKHRIAQDGPAGSVRSRLPSGVGVREETVARHVFREWSRAMRQTSASQVKAGRPF